MVNLYCKGILKHTLRNTVIDYRASCLLNDYFSELECGLQDLLYGNGYEPENFAGMTYLDLALSNPDYEEEEMQHILVALHPEEFNPIY